MVTQHRQDLKDMRVWDMQLYPFYEALRELIAHNKATEARRKYEMSQWEIRNKNRK